MSTTPTIGFNVESLVYKNVNLTVWDIGGQDKIRVLWRHYYANTTGLIFVVDSNDHDRIDEAAMELTKAMKEEDLTQVKLLVFANKQVYPISFFLLALTTLAVGPTECDGSGKHEESSWPARLALACMAPAAVLRYHWRGLVRGTRLAHTRHPKWQITIN